MHLVLRLCLLLIAEVRNISVWKGRYNVMGLLSPLLGSILVLHSQHPLSIVSNKVSEAWTKIWSDTWCPTVTIMAPGGRDLDDF